MDRVTAFQQAKFRSFIATLGVLTYLKEQDLSYFDFVLYFPSIKIDGCIYVVTLSRCLASFFVDFFLKDQGFVGPRFKVRDDSPGELLKNLETIPTHLKQHIDLPRVYAETVGKFTSPSYEVGGTEKMLLDCCLTFGRRAPKCQVEALEAYVSRVLTTCSNILELHLTIIHKPKPLPIKNRPVCDRTDLLRALGSSRGSVNRGALRKRACSKSGAGLSCPERPPDP